MTQCAALLRILGDGEWHTCADILRAEPMIVHSRIADLRAKGHVVEHETTGKGARWSRYRLVSLEPLASSPLHGGNDGNGAGGSSEDGPESLTERVLLEPGEGQDAALLSSLGEPLGAEDRPVPAPLPGQLELLPLPTRG